MHGDLQSDSTTRSAAGASGRRPIARVLLVEDSLLIALDAEDALAAGGASDVVVAANVADALAAIAEALPDFAVLDFNLGAETSEPVARALAAADVPFCFATGYGDALDRADAAPPCGVLKKPYSKADIAAAMACAAEMRAGG